MSCILQFASSCGKNQPGHLRVGGGGVFRARLRPDVFVSVDGGTLPTRRLRLAGAGLLLNGSEPISVELLSAKGKTLGRCEVEGDSLRHRLLFRGKSLGQLRIKEPLRLRFAVRDGGRLYSFAARRARRGSRLSALSFQPPDRFTPAASAAPAGAR